MPNWCYNKVTLEHKDPAMITRAVEAFKQGNFLQEFIPCPQDLLEATAGGGWDKDSGTERKRVENQEKYGFPSWYEHNATKWGTKWDVGDEDGVEDDYEPDSNTVSLAFESAWSPPVPAYAVLEELGFDVTAYYYEPGMAFCGYYDGEDHEYPTDNYDAIPEDIRDEFGIEEYDEEEEDE